MFKINFQANCPSRTKIPNIILKCINSTILLNTGANLQKSKKNKELCAISSQGKKNTFPLLYIKSINTKLCFCPITSATKWLASTHRMKTPGCSVCQRVSHTEGLVEGSLGPHCAISRGHPTISILVLFIYCERQYILSI